MTGRWLGALLLLMLALTVPAAAGDAARWSVEPGSTVGFIAKQAGAEVEGVFERFEAEILFGPAALTVSKVAVEIEVASVNSQSADRDQTIRSAPLFDVATWPSARFEAERFEAVSMDANGNGEFRALGRLTMRDVTREVVLPFRLSFEDHPDEAGALRAHAAGELTVSRLDYGVGQGLWTDTSVVADEVVIVIDILAKRAKE